MSFGQQRSIYYHNFASQISHLINLVNIIATNQSMKVSTTIMSLVFLLNGVPGNLLPQPLNSETVQLHLDHWCSSQSCTLNTGAVKNGGCFGHTY